VEDRNSRFKNDRELNQLLDNRIRRYSFWRVFNRFSEFVHNLGSLILSAIILLILYQIIMRFTNLSSFNVVELTSYLLIWITFLCVPAAYRRNRHIKVDIIYGRLKRRYRFILDIFASVAGIFIAMIMIWQGIQLQLLSYHEKEVTLILKLPVYVLITVLPLSMLFFSVECFEKIFRASMALRISKDYGPPGFLDEKPKKSEIELEIEGAVADELSLEAMVSDSRD